MGPGYDYGAPNSVHQLPYDAIPSFEPNFNVVMLQGRGKLPDLVRSPAITNTGYLVSERLRTLLEEFTLPLRRFYPVKALFRQKEVLGYCWIQLPEPRLPLTDDMSIETAESVIESVTELAALDLLRLYHPARFAYCLITDRLKRGMEAAKIIGVRFGTAKLFR